MHEKYPQLRGAKWYEVGELLYDDHTLGLVVNVEYDFEEWNHTYYIWMVRNSLGMVENCLIRHSALDLLTWERTSKRFSSVP